MDIEMLHICWSTLTQTQKLPKVRALYLCVLQPAEKMNIHMGFQQNLPENIYIWGPCAAFCFKWDNLFHLLEVPCNGFCHLTVRISTGLWDIPSIYLCSVMVPESSLGRRRDSWTCRHDSPFLGRLCRVWVLSCILWNWAANEQQWMCPSWVFDANSLNKDWEVREKMNVYHSLPCGDDCSSVSPPWILTPVIIWYQTNRNYMIQWILTGICR